MESAILLNEWDGDGTGSQYTWTLENREVISEYIEESHSLKVELKINNKTEFSTTEKLNINSKPNIFTMRKTAERLINQQIA